MISVSRRFWREYVKTLSDSNSSSEPSPMFPLMNATLLTSSYNCKMNGTRHTWLLNFIVVAHTAAYHTVLKAFLKSTKTWFRYSLMLPVIPRLNLVVASSSEIHLIFSNDLPCLWFQSFQYGFQHAFEVDCSVVRMFFSSVRNLPDLSSTVVVWSCFSVVRFFSICKPFLNVVFLSNCSRSHQSGYLSEFLLPTSSSAWHFTIHHLPVHPAAHVSFFWFKLLTLKSSLIALGFTSGFLFHLLLSYCQESCQLFPSCLPSCLKILTFHVSVVIQSFLRILLASREYTSVFVRGWSRGDC